MYCYPSPTDKMWNSECEKIMPYLRGRGLNLGSGQRGIYGNEVRVDLNPETKPDHVCSGDSLPFKDREFDYLYSIHSFEHFEDQKKTIAEWKRVVKKEGIIALVHPDLTYTKVQREEQWHHDVFNRHFHERTYNEFLEYLKANNYFGMQLVASGEACKEWSFYVVLKV